MFDIAEHPVLSSAVTFDAARLDSQKLRIRNLEHKASVPSLCPISWPSANAKTVMAS